MMLSDKELLVLAAKAAGLDYRPNDGEIRYGDAAMKWNPLENDGAALRLAVKLRMDLILSSSEVESAFDNNCKQHAEPIGNDPLSATRRAIVRAAAAIGESM